MNAGPPSSVWTRLGLTASFRSRVIAPYAFKSLARTGALSAVSPTTMRASRRSRSSSPLAGGRRVDPGDEHQPACRLAARQGLEPDLRLVLSVQLDLVVGEPELGGNLGDRTELRGLGDRDVGGDLGRSGHGASRARAWIRAAVRTGAARSPSCAVRPPQAAPRGPGRVPRPPRARTPARSACRDAARGRGRVRPSRPRAGLPDSRTVGPWGSSS